MQFEELAISSFVPHDSNYDDDDDSTDSDDDSTDSDLDYSQQEGNAYKRVDLYDFVHDTCHTLDLEY